MAFSFAQKKAYQGGVTGTPGPAPPQLRPWGHLKMVLEADDMIISSGGRGGGGGRNGQIRH